MASTRAWTVLTTLCCIALAPVGARASLTTEAGQDEVIATLGSAVTIKAHNANANTQLNQALSDPGFWEGSWAKTYTDKTYDQIKMKPLDSGYFPMIGGEGGQDFDHDVVSHVVFNRQTELPKYMSGAKAVVPLGRGIDSEVGAEFNDVFLVLDLTFFYATYPQRMYKRHDVETNTTVCWFEKIDASFMDADAWSAYQTKMTATVDGMSKRWPPFNSVIEVGEVYGMFIVSPGTTQKSRVTFISKLAFDSSAGWLAKWGSQLPGVLRAGLRSGFGASVAIAEHEQARREKAKGK